MAENPTSISSSAAVEGWAIRLLRDLADALRDSAAVRAHRVSEPPGRPESAT